MLKLVVFQTGKNRTFFPAISFLSKNCFSSFPFAFKPSFHFCLLFWRCHPLIFICFINNINKKTDDFKTQIPSKKFHSKKLLYFINTNLHIQAIDIFNNITPIDLNLHTYLTTHVHKKPWSWTTWVITLSEKKKHIQMNGDVMHQLAKNRPIIIILNGMNRKQEFQGTCNLQFTCR